MGDFRAILKKYVDYFDIYARIEGEGMRGSQNRKPKAED
jgi:hypothetical protein